AESVALIVTRMTTPNRPTELSVLIGNSARRLPALAGSGMALTPFQYLKVANKRATISNMKLVAQIQLKPTEHQHHLLKATLERANAACNIVSAYAWTHKTFGQYDLHHALYTSLRADFSLTAQMVVRCISKVADAYKLDKANKRHFKAHGSIAYDSRILK